MPMLGVKTKDKNSNNLEYKTRSHDTVTIMQVTRIAAFLEGSLTRTNATHTIKNVPTVHMHTNPSLRNLKMDIYNAYMVKDSILDKSLGHLM